MANLTETAYYTRRTVNWLIIGFFAYLFLRVLWALAVTLWLIAFPPKPPPPNFAFNKLPALQFPKTATPSGDLTFRLETIEGAVPRGPDTAVVYLMPKQAANLLALTKTQDFAQRLSLNPNPIQESKNIYRFEDDDVPLRRLRYDIVSNNFILRYLYEQDTGLFAERILPSSDASIAEAKSLLQTYNVYVDDLAQGISKVTFLKLRGDTLISTTSLSQSDAVRVDMFRKDIEKTPVYSPFPDEGPVSILFSGATQSKKRILQFAYTFWPIDYETKGTYPIKPSTLAWQELQTGNGYIARYPTTGKTALVRTVKIGYYDSFDPQTYLQPIYVFEGDFGFLGFVPAVSPEWTE